MTKQTISALTLSLALAVGIAAPVRADILQTLSVTGPTNYYSPTPTTIYDSTNGYDFSNLSNYPPTTAQYIGSFEFTIPTGEVITGITITGYFGNTDSPTTSLADFYLGDSTDGETAVDVANCNDVSQNCFSDGTDGPYFWTATLSATDLGNLTAANNGTLDFSYEWVNNAGIQAQSAAGPFYVYAGPTSIDIQVSPEPATALIFLGGLAGIAALRRFRKA